MMTTKFHSEANARGYADSYEIQGVTCEVSFDETAERRPWIVIAHITPDELDALEAATLRRAYRRMK